MMLPGVDGAEEGFAIASDLVFSLLKSSAKDNALRIEEVGASRDAAAGCASRDLRAATSLLVNLDRPVRRDDDEVDELAVLREMELTVLL